MHRPPVPLIVRIDKRGNIVEENQYVTRNAAGVLVWDDREIRARRLLTDRREPGT